MKFYIIFLQINSLVMQENLCYNIGVKKIKKQHFRLPKVLFVFLYAKTHRDMPSGHNTSVLNKLFILIVIVSASFL